MERSIRKAPSLSSLLVSYFGSSHNSGLTWLPFVLDEDGSGDNYLLILDLLALHMVRTNAESSTIISYHPHSDWKTTPAKSLYARVYLAGQSVYWRNIFKKSNDPTFVLLATLWYALYAWDEAFETLWEHICQLVRYIIYWQFHTQV
jgi:hypothetical protein